MLTERSKIFTGGGYKFTDDPKTVYHIQWDEKNDNSLNQGTTQWWQQKKSQQLVIDLKKKSPMKFSGKDLSPLLMADAVWRIWMRLKSKNLRSRRNDWTSSSACHKIIIFIIKSSQIWKVWDGSVDVVFVWYFIPNMRNLSTTTFIRLIGQGDNQCCDVIIVDR